MKMLKIRVHAIVVLMLVFLWALLVMPQDASAAASWKSKVVRFAATAGETLAVGDVVCIAGSDGKAYLADANDSSLRPAVGVVGKGGASGATVEVVVQGIITGMTAASPGARLFLSETAGDFTTTGPDNAQPLGFVLPSNTAGSSSSTNYFIDVKVPSSAGAAY